MVRRSIPRTSGWKNPAWNMSELNFQAVYGRAPGDQYGQALDEQLANEAAVVPPDNPLDDEASQATLRQLLSW